MPACYDVVRSRLKTKKTYFQAQQQLQLTTDPATALPTSAAYFTIIRHLEDVNVQQIISLSQLHLFH